MAVRHRLADGLLGSIVALVTAPTGVGVTLGGWLAARRTETPLGGALAGGVAGLVAALPVGALVYLASAGAIDPIGYHEGVVHVGVNTAAPGTFALWQELAFALVTGGVLLGAGVIGGVLAGAATEVGRKRREELATA
ncbi:MAG: hypothetical protein V5A44_11950 [Haloarculaceae archaeon]